MGRAEISVLQKHSGAGGQEEERRGRSRVLLRNPVGSASSDSLPQHLPTCHVQYKVPLSPPLREEDLMFITINFPGEEAERLREVADSQKVE